MKRRNFVTAASLAAAGMLLPIGCNSWVAQQANASNDKRLVVVFLRGGVDGLNILVPHQTAEYYEARPTIAVPYPKQPNGAIDLDGYFGLNPRLKDLMPFWKQKQLAFVHSCGLPLVERSHFQAQDYLENGTPGVRNTNDGWMNRLLAQLPQEGLTQALNVGVTTPYILRGEQQIASLKPGINSTALIPTDRSHVKTAFSQLYNGTDELSKAFQAGTKAREIVLAELDREMEMASKNAQNADVFADDAAEVAKLMVGNANTKLAFMEIGNWDTHVNQNPILNRQLPLVGKGLAILAAGLEPIWDDTVVVVMSEFGRTVRENGNKGTDHGFGNAMWLLGGGVEGGIYGEWSGLADSVLYKNRDVFVNTDFREVLSQIIVNHLAVPSDRLNEIFPDYQLTNPFNLLA